MSEAAHGDDEDLTIKRVPILPSYHIGTSTVRVPRDGSDRLAYLKMPLFLEFGFFIDEFQQFL